ncbi:MAG: ATP-binding protein, partial [Methanosarcinales archaeon]
MQFFNREKEKAEIRKILELEPSVVYFFYGPINSGKTALIVEVIRELPSNYRVFYFNFRGYTLQSHEDFYDILFEVDEKTKIEGLQEYLSGITESLSKISEKAIEFGTGIKIPISKVLFDKIFERKEKSKDIFNYLESFFIHLKKKRIQPVFILDEIQRLKGLKNNGELLSELFNFFVRMTKETHLCHCLALTSDSLFVEYVYNRAELQERAKYIKVDDFSREDALNYLELNGLGEYKEEIISKVGCKPSLLSIVVNESKIAEVNDKNMKDILCDMIKDQKQKIQSTLELLRYITPKVKW